MLIVEDESDLQRVLAYNFRQAGFDVVSAINGETALRALKEERFDLIILDLMLPDVSGTELCRRIKQNPQTAQTPIVMVTAKGEEVDRVVGFELGADDYVVKPFSVRELILRARAVLRRSEGTSTAPERFDFGGLRIDRAAHRAWVEGQEVALTALEFRLLMMLYDRRGRVLSRDLLLDEVWGSHADVTARNVDTHVKRVREKLGSAGEYIETVRGVGYRFRSDASEESDG
ncbi:Phosphate regulon transcriptional regulatory protein PhoB (SphR) [Chondromyces apiculatus DSM 436]|uniref:Phosphate regulon transcriptional regulatory protein PhoB n=1 Tax=Chondromyces apiculatus DSM 436 TaxID=1192034 RepID=A0A017T9W5_9BACT|nr:Phosphate regulon transcriptional regulatory protein PhoB (SphR) [Chondromyces apiculatus DSM 436]